MLLTNTPIPTPSIVWLLVVVGFDEVLQHTPLAVTVDPPSDVTFPPLLAVVCVVLVTAVVVTVGRTGFGESVVNVTSFP